MRHAVHVHRASLNNSGHLLLPGLLQLIVAAAAVASTCNSASTSRTWIQQKNGGQREIYSKIYCRSLNQTNAPATARVIILQTKRTGGHVSHPRSGISEGPVTLRLIDLHHSRHGKWETLYSRSLYITNLHWSHTVLRGLMPWFRIMIKW